MEDAEPSAFCVATHEWMSLTEQEPSAPTYGITASDVSTSSSFHTQVWYQKNHPPSKFGPASPFI